jgi:DNA polymerase elongation subunit (family B)
MTNSIVKEMGCEPKYNDTDSVYFTHPFEKFKDILDKPERGDKYHKRMVHRSMKLSFTRQQLIEWYTNKYFKSHNMKPRRLSYDELVEITKDEKYHKSILRIPEKGFNDIVNDRISEFLGSNQIKFVREETCYPHVILMKKKYFGLKHEFSYTENITLNNLIIKGISYVTRNASKFMKSFLSEMMLDILRSPEIDIENIVFNKVKSMYMTNY